MLPCYDHPTVIGVLLAAAVLAIVLGGLWWMLHPSVHAHLGLNATEDETPTLLVPVTAATPPEMLRLAGLIANEDHVDVTLLHIVEMPYTLPIDALLHDGDGGNPAFLREFRRKLEELGLTVHCKVGRARRAGKAIIDWAKATRPHAVVLGMLPRPRAVFGSTTSYVVENAGSLRVIVFKP